MPKKLDIRCVRCYSAEQYDKDGIGIISIDFDINNLTKDEIASRILEIKNDIKRQNAEYRGKHNSSNPNISKRVNDIYLITPNEKFLDLDPTTGNTTLLLGSSKAGKSTLLRHIYNNEYSGNDFITSLFSINSYCDVYGNDKNLLKCQEFNDESINLIKEMKYLQYRKKNKFKFAFLFDDLIEIRHKNIINNLILTYRNANISSVISLQYPNLLSKQSRSNVNNICFFKFNTAESIEIAIQCYLRPYFNNMDIHPTNHVKKYIELTKDHQFIYLNPQKGILKFMKLKL